jgi:hypothetical protein
MPAVQHPAVSLVGDGSVHKVTVLRSLADRLVNTLDRPNDDVDLAEVRTIADVLAESSRRSTPGSDWPPRRLTGRSCRPRRYPSSESSCCLARRGVRTFRPASACAWFVALTVQKWSHEPFLRRV